MKMTNRKPLSVSQIGIVGIVVALVAGLAYVRLPEVEYTFDYNVFTGGGSKAIKRDEPFRLPNGELVRPDDVVWLANLLGHRLATSGGYYYVEHHVKQPKPTSNRSFIEPVLKPFSNCKDLGTLVSGRFRALWVVPSES